MDSMRKIQHTVELVDVKANVEHGRRCELQIDQRLSLQQRIRFAVLLLWRGLIWLQRRSKDHQVGSFNEWAKDIHSVKGTARCSSAKLNLTNS